MTDADGESREHHREVAHNESVRQTIGDVRVSIWAIAVAVVLGLAAIGWVFVHDR